MNLQKYLNLQEQIQNYKENEQAVQAILFQELCGVDPYDLQKIDTQTVREMTHELNSFMSQTEHPLHPIITIGEVEYGFVPNLSKIEYGAYLDITKYDDIGINDDWKYIMNILYRPVIEKKGHHYTVKPYNSEEGGEDKWLEVGMDIHLGAYFFFINLLTDLVKSTLNSMKEEETDPLTKSILERSGKDINQLFNLQKMTLRSLIGY